ncbi:MAG: LON peptidase substrate-binding domain-containing protein, partial [Candidatus Aminicenantes bacterium]|nr:LON peptidase substrate-binding domain-containing protein [Candidatus Aminicenantes bacterium]
MEKEIDKNNDSIIKPEEEKLPLPENLPVLVLRDIVVFPYMIVPLYVGRSKSKKAIDHALNSDRMILLLTQKDASIEDPDAEDLYRVGTVALVVRMLKLPDGRMRVLVQGISRVKVKSINDNGKIITSNIKTIEDKEPKQLNIKDKALIRNIRQKFEQTGKLGKQIPNEIFVITENIEEPGKLSDIIASNLDLKIEDSQKILQEEDSIKRIKKVYDFL